MLSKEKKNQTKKPYLLSIFLFVREDKCQAFESSYSLITAKSCADTQLSTDAFRKSIVNHRAFCHVQIFSCYYEYQSDLLDSEISCIFINYWQENILSEKYFIMCLLTDCFPLSFSMHWKYWSFSISDLFKSIPFPICHLLSVFFSSFYPVILNLLCLFSLFIPYFFFLWTQLATPNKVWTHLLVPRTHHRSYRPSAHQIKMTVQMSI